MLKRRVTWTRRTTYRKGVEVTNSAFTISDSIHILAFKDHATSFPPANCTRIHGNSQIVFFEHRLDLWQNCFCSRCNRLRCFLLCATDPVRLVMFLPICVDRGRDWRGGRRCGWFCGCLWCFNLDSMSSYFFATLKSNETHDLS